MDDIEDVLAERLCDLHDNHLSYLVKTWNLVSNEMSRVSGRVDFLAKFEYIKKILLLYFVIELENQGKVDQDLLRLLTPSLDSDVKIPFNLLDSFFLMYSPKDLSNIIKPMIQRDIQMMSQKTLNDDYLPPLQILVQLTNHQQVCKLIATSPTLVMGGTNGLILETKSFLGPFFSLTPLSHADVLFKNIQYMTETEVESIQDGLRSGIRSMQNELYRIIGNLIKDTSTSSLVLRWASLVLEYNKTRAMMREDPNSSSRDGFLLNYTAVLLKFVNQDFDWKKIDPTFALTKLPVDFSSVSKLGKADDVIPSKEFNLETQIFYWAHRAIQIGFLNTVGKYKQLSKDCEKCWREYQKLLAEQSPNAQAELDRYAKLGALQLSVITHLYEPDLVSNIFAFYSNTATWFSSLGDPEKTGKLSSPPNKLVLIQPDFMIENMIEFLQSLTIYKKNHFDNLNFREIFHVLILYMDNTEYILNPHLRMKVPTLLGTLTLETGIPKHLLAESLTDDKFAQEHLITNLMRLYVEMERTGSSQQFYTKFEPRYYSALLIKYLWSFKAYKESFVSQSKSDDTLKFFNMVLNDATYLLDEAIKNLQMIHKFEADSGSESWSTLSQQIRTERETEFVQAEKTATSCMNLANETVHMISFISQSVKEPFLRIEMLPRLASMLNYFLDQLAGPKCSQLRVNNREKYHFDPKNLLSEICDIYMNLSTDESFLKEIASDGRCFSVELFEKTLSVLQRIKTREKYIAKFGEMIIQLKSASENLKGEEENLGDIPDEYLCPITYVLMKDPVKLPSDHIVDRQAIVRHLLNDPTDPFTRSPLEVSQLVAQPDLKDQIEKWRLSKK